MTNTMPTPYRTLHLITGSPYSTDAMQACRLALSISEDAVLLLQDAVYWACHLPLDLPPSCFILEADASARGIHSIPEPIRQVDYAGWVHLVEQSQKTCTW